ncbi:MAG: FMN-dependent NADH-azoreductase [Cetobacterium sp.]
MKVLCILANPKPVEESYSKRACMEFVNGYKKTNPDHELVVLDLYEKQQEHLSYETLSNAMKNNSNKMTHEATYFSSFDKYIVCAPMWNLTVPSILKSYIDHIVVKGITFKYSSNGIPGGMLKNKKVLYIGSRGGAYPFPLSLIAWDDKYIRFIFRFIGIKDFKKIIFQNTDKDPIKAAAKFPDFLNKIREHSRIF